MNVIEKILAVINKGEILTSQQIKDRISATYYNGDIPNAAMNRLKAQLWRMAKLGWLDKDGTSRNQTYKLIINKSEYSPRKVGSGWQIGCYYEGTLIGTSNFISTRQEELYKERCKNLVPNCTFERHNKPNTLPKVYIVRQKTIEVNRKYAARMITKPSNNKPIEWFGSMKVATAERLVKQEYGTTNYRNLTRTQINELYGKYNGTAI